MNLLRCISLPEPPSSFTLSSDGRLAFAISEWETGAWLSVLDTETGTILHRERDVAALALHPLPCGVLTVDTGWRSAGKASPRLMAFERHGARIDVTVRELPASTHVQSVDADGRRLAISDQGVLRVVSWPGLEPSFELRGSGDVDFDVELAFVRSGPVSRRADLRVASLDGRSERLLAIDDGISADPVGHGYVQVWPGARLVVLDGTGEIELVPARATTRHPPRASLRSDGTAARLVHRGHPLSVALPTPASARPRRAAITIADGRSGCFHPLRDDVVYTKRKHRTHLRKVAGEVIAFLGEDWLPRAFTEDRLFLQRGAEIEVWSID
jgi:hypothetical protein